MAFETVKSWPFIAVYTWYVDVTQHEFNDSSYIIKWPFNEAGLYIVHPLLEKKVFEILNSDIYMYVSTNNAD